MTGLRVLAGVLTLLWVTAGCVSAAEMPDSVKQKAAITGQALSPFPAAMLSGQAIDGPKAQKAIKVAQRWRRRRRRRRGAAVAGAIALGVLGAIAASKAARARGDYYYDDGYAYRHHKRCRRWARKCDRGHIWACDKLDYNC